MRPRRASARGGSLAARGKQVYSSCGSRRECFDTTYFLNTQILVEIMKEILNSSTSRIKHSCKNTHLIIIIINICENSLLILSMMMVKVFLRPVMRIDRFKCE